VQIFLPIRSHDLPSGDSQRQQRAGGDRPSGLPVSLAERLFADPNMYQIEKRCKSICFRRTAPSQENWNLWSQEQRYRVFGKSVASDYLIVLAPCRQTVPVDQMEYPVISTVRAGMATLCCIGRKRMQKKTKRFSEITYLGRQCFARRVRSCTGPRWTAMQRSSSRRRRGPLAFQLLPSLGHEVSSGAKPRGRYF
jgi:hypothetical protein